MSAAMRVSIRRHQFQINCAGRDEEVMRAAARLVEEKIRELRDKTGVADGERAALMAALQIAFEARRAPADSSAAAAAPDVGGMLRRIDDALARTESSLQGRAPMA